MGFRLGLMGGRIGVVGGVSGGKSLQSAGEKEVLEEVLKLLCVLALPSFWIRDVTPEPQEKRVELRPHLLVVALVESLFSGAEGFRCGGLEPARVRW